MDKPADGGRREGPVGWLDFSGGKGTDSAICILSRLPAVRHSGKLAPRQTLHTKK